MREAVGNRIVDWEIDWETDGVRQMKTARGPVLLNTEQALAELLALPQLADSPACGRFTSGETADAASYLAEANVRISEEQRDALLAGIEEYADGDRALFEAYARLLNPENWE